MQLKYEHQSYTCNEAQKKLEVTDTKHDLCTTLS